MNEHHAQTDFKKGRSEHVEKEAGCIAPKLGESRGERQVGTTEKRCNRCGLTKTISQFTRDKWKKDGYHTLCKVCKYVGYHKWYSERSENVAWLLEYRRQGAERSRRRLRNPEIREGARRLAVEFHKKNDWRQDQTKVYARTLLRRARHAGKIPVPLLCERCNLKKHLHGHHEDYSKPLEVKWLCRQCHADIHRERRVALLLASVTQ